MHNPQHVLEDTKFVSLYILLLFSFFQDIEYIRSHYNIEDFIYFNHHKREEHGHLHHYALNPVFTHMSKYFIKEILRQGHKTCLYYPLYPAYTSKEVSAIPEITVNPFNTE